MKNIPVVMIRENLSGVPQYQLPEGYRIRNWKEGDKRLWAEVETAAGEFKSVESGIAQFELEFEKHPEEMIDRIVFLENEKGEAVGTAMGWFDDNFFRADYGRVHWVGIVPEYQGKGLAKPLVSHIMNIISSRHERVYLTTQTESFKAIKIYLDFGFEPFIQDPSCPEAWKLMANLLQHPALSQWES